MTTDELRFETRDWDSVLKRYVGLFPDHVYRLRVSDNKFMNYCDVFTCMIKPESFAIFTRKWIAATEGFGDCWGSDVQHQLVAYFLGMGLEAYDDIWRNGAYCRDIPILDLTLSGMVFAQDQT